MKYSNCFIRADGRQEGIFKTVPEDAVRHIVRLDGDMYPGAMLLEAMWLTAPCQARGMKMCRSGTMWVFAGSDVNDHENL
ncbi:MAG: hypothetical protein GX823_02540, partial [Clostridiales bacterium]|nr:hypothetical protein [Clostridiales bacterium]